MENHPKAPINGADWCSKWCSRWCSKKPQNIGFQGMAAGKEWYIQYHIIDENNSVFSETFAKASIC